MTPKQFARFAADPAAFRDSLIVDVDGTARRFGQVMDGWQRDDFAALDPALMAAAGRSKEPARSRAWLERPRGHSKTTDLAILVVWALVFATRPLRGYAYAKDKDQAKLLRDAVANIVRLNPWIGTILQVQTHGVVNVAKGHPGEGGTLTIEASDVGSSYGILPDLIIADELCHWEGDGSLWNSLLSSAAKRANCLMVVISNAGFADSWQWSIREAARTDESWIFSRLDGPRASWMTEARLAEQRRMLPAVAFARLWLNEWSSGGGDALLPSDIDAAFRADLEPMRGRVPGWLFVAGVDLGLTRDCSAVVVLAVPDGRWGKIRLANHRLWRPTLGQKIDLRDVEEHILELDREYNLETVAFDPWQAELLAARLEAESSRRRRSQPNRAWAKAWMREVQPTAANLREQATITLESFADRRLELFECEPLRRDLMKLRVEEKSYGCRLTSPRDDHGHGDSFSAFANALLIAHELSTKKRVVAGAIDFSGGRSPLERALERGREEAERFDREQEEWRRGEDHQAGFRDIMRQIAPERLGGGFPFGF